MSLRPSRVWKYWVARLGIRSRVRELERELRAEFPDLTRITPSKHSGGFDSIFHLQSGQETFGVLRLNNPRLRRAVTRPTLPRINPSPTERIEREWTAYSRLAPLGLSPRALWRSHDAIACTYSSSPRLRHILEQRLIEPVQAFTSVMNAIGRMHEANVVSLDLSPGNILVCPQSLKVTLIDFEYVSLPGRAFTDDCVFDWQNFVTRIRDRAAVIERSVELDAALRQAVERCEYQHDVTLQRGLLAAESPASITSRALRRAA